MCSILSKPVRVGNGLTKNSSYEVRMHQGVAATDKRNFYLAPTLKFPPKMCSVYAVKEREREEEDEAAAESQLLCAFFSLIVRSSRRLSVRSSPEEFRVINFPAVCTSTHYLSTTVR